MAKYVHELSHRLLTTAPLFPSKVLLVFTCHISQARVQAVGINSLTRNHRTSKLFLNGFYPPWFTSPKKTDAHARGGLKIHSTDILSTRSHQSVLDTLLPAVGAWAPCTAAGWALKVAAARPSNSRPRLLGGKPASRARHPTGRLGLLLFLIVFWSILPCTGTCWRDRGGNIRRTVIKGRGTRTRRESGSSAVVHHLTYRNQRGDRASQLWPLEAESCSLYTDILFQRYLDHRRSDRYM
ncbi:hypothetical protein HDV62DRAFT_171608 [Trichoderma sp. SZMC 28011]